MGLYNFQKRFAPMILDGSKTHTIRAPRKDGRLPKQGELLHLYTGLRQKGARLLMRVPCAKVDTITIGLDGVVWIKEIDDLGYVRKGRLFPAGEERLAIADGFNTFAEMMKFWEGRLPFEGNIIHWDFNAATNKENRIARDRVPAAMPEDGMQKPDRSETPNG